MDRWRDKIAVVTGCSSGIGAACARHLLKNNVKVVALARRYQRLEELKASLPDGQKDRCFIMKCDVTVEQEVKDTFQKVVDLFQGVDILINNAGVSRETDLVAEDNTEKIRQVIDTNIMGVFFCTREAFQIMKRNKVAGHIVHINSIAGHKIPNFGPQFPSFNIYPATKFGVTAMTEIYRQEFLHKGTKIKVTSVSPGATDTEIFPTEFEELKATFPLLHSDDVADAIMYVLGTPPHVQIHELTIKPLGEPM